MIEARAIEGLHSRSVIAISNLASNQVFVCSYPVWIFYFYFQGAPIQCSQCYSAVHANRLHAYASTMLRNAYLRYNIASRLSA
jgi:hypothetical protein